MTAGLLQVLVALFSQSDDPGAVENGFLVDRLVCHGWVSKDAAHALY
jgi:hypothetical protein